MGQFRKEYNYTPKPGDIIYYVWDNDWNYDQTGNRRFVDHIGIVLSIDWRGDILV